MPKGSGLSFNHFKLTNLIFDWVDALPVGKVFTVFDLTEYIQTQASQSCLNIQRKDIGEMVNI